MPALTLQFTPGNEHIEKEIQQMNGLGKASFCTVRDVEMGLTPPLIAIIHDSGLDTLKAYMRHEFLIASLTIQARTSFMKYQDKFGNTLLHYAATAKDPFILVFILRVIQEYELNLQELLNLKNNQNQTVLDRAIESRDPAIIENMRIVFSALPAPDYKHPKNLTPTEHQLLKLSLQKLFPINEWLDELFTIDELTGDSPLFRWVSDKDLKQIFIELIETNQELKQQFLAHPKRIDALIRKIETEGPFMHMTPAYCLCVQENGRKFFSSLFSEHDLEQAARNKAFLDAILLAPNTDPNHIGSSILFLLSKADGCRLLLDFFKKNPSFYSNKFELSDALFRIQPKQAQSAAMRLMAHSLGNEIFLTILRQNWLSYNDNDQKIKVVVQKEQDRTFRDGALLDEEMMCTNMDTDWSKVENLIRERPALLYIITTKDKYTLTQLAVLKQAPLPTIPLLSVHLFSFKQQNTKGETIFHLLSSNTESEYKVNALQLVINLCEEKNFPLEYILKIPNNDNLTAIDLARKNQNTKILKMLESALQDKSMVVDIKQQLPVAAQSIPSLSPEKTQEKTKFKEFKRTLEKALKILPSYQEKLKHIIELLSDYDDEKEGKKLEPFFIILLLTKSHGGNSEIEFDITYITTILMKLISIIKKNEPQALGIVSAEEKSDFVSAIIQAVRYSVKNNCTKKEFDKWCAEESNQAYCSRMTLMLEKLSTALDDKGFNDFTQTIGTIYNPLKASELQRRGQYQITIEEPIIPNCVTPPAPHVQVDVEKMIEVETKLERPKSHVLTEVSPKIAIAAANPIVANPRLANKKTNGGLLKRFRKAKINNRLETIHEEREPEHVAQPLPLALPQMVNQSSMSSSESMDSSGGKSSGGKPTELTYGKVRIFQSTKPKKTNNPVAMNAAPAVSQDPSKLPFIISTESCVTLMIDINLALRRNEISTLSPNVLTHIATIRKVISADRYYSSLEQGIKQQPELQQQTVEKIITLFDMVVLSQIIPIFIKDPDSLYRKLDISVITTIIDNYLDLIGQPAMLTTKMIHSLIHLLDIVNKTQCPEAVEFETILTKSILRLLQTMSISDVINLSQSSGPIISQFFELQMCDDVKKQARIIPQIHGFSDLNAFLPPDVLFFIRGIERVFKKIKQIQAQQLVLAGSQIWNASYNLKSDLDIEFFLQIMELSQLKDIFSSLIKNLQDLNLVQISNIKQISDALLITLSIQSKDLLQKYFLDIKINGGTDSIEKQMQRSLLGRRLKTDALMLINDNLLRSFTCTNRSMDFWSIAPNTDDFCHALYVLSEGVHCSYASRFAQQLAQFFQLAYDDNALLMSTIFMPAIQQFLNKLIKKERSIDYILAKLETIKNSFLLFAGELQEKKLVASDRSNLDRPLFSTIMSMEDDKLSRYVESNPIYYTDDNGDTIFHGVAAMNQSQLYKIYQLLIERNMSPLSIAILLSTKNKNGQTPINIAESNSNPDDALIMFIKHHYEPFENQWVSFIDKLKAVIAAPSVGNAREAFFSKHGKDLLPAPDNVQQIGLGK